MHIIMCMIILYCPDMCSVIIIYRMLLHGFQFKILTNEFPCIYFSLKYRVCESLTKLVLQVWRQFWVNTTTTYIQNNIHAHLICSINALQCIFTRNTLYGTLDHCMYERSQYNNIVSYFPFTLFWVNVFQKTSLFGFRKLEVWDTFSPPLHPQNKF